MKKLTLKNKTIAAATLFALTLTLATASAQKIDNTNMFSSNQVIDYNIEYFKVMEVDKKLYFKFLITEEKENTAYVLESSTNGQAFTFCQIKEGYKSPNNTPLLYCFSEKLNKNNATVYRVKRVSFDGTIGYSCGLMLDQGNTARVWNSCIHDSYDKDMTLKNKENEITPTASAY